MRATGIVRRIDELGRVVIPKEIRRTFFFNDTATTEIYTAADGEVVFKKYSPLAELGQLSAIYAEVLAKTLGRAVLVCDRARITAASGGGRTEMVGRELSPQTERLLAARSVYTAPEDPARRHKLLEQGERLALCAAPIVAHGDVEGAILLPGTAKDPVPPAEDVQAVALAASFLSRWMEE